MKTLLFWIKVVALVVACWGGFFLVGFLRGEHFGVSFFVAATIPIVGISVFYLAVYGPDVPLFAPRWSRRWKEYKKQKRSSVEDG